MELWFTEKQKKNLKISCSVEKVLVHKKSDYQEIAILDTGPMGRILAIDGYIQTTQLDEFIYHEMIAHVPLSTHPNPAEVMVIGGGDGGTVREVLKHPGVAHITLVEIDRLVVQLSQEYLPELSCELNNAKVNIAYMDGVNYVSEQKNRFDVIIVDSTEPVGPAASLFSRAFFQNVYEALRDDGIMVAQAESPFYNQNLIQATITYLREFFPVVKLYLAPVPSYPGGLWSFALGSKKYLPDVHDHKDLLQRAGLVKNCRYYTPQIHLASFNLPPFITEFAPLKVF